MRQNSNVEGVCVCFACVYHALIPSNIDTHTQHTHAHTHAHARTHTHTHSVTLSYSVTLSFSPSLSHTHTHAKKPVLSLSYEGYFGTSFASSAPNPEVPSSVANICAAMYFWIAMISVFVFLKSCALGFWGLEVWLRIRIWGLVRLPWYLFSSP